MNSTSDATNRAAKRQRTIRTLLFVNEEHRVLPDVLKMLKSIDICAFLLMVNAQPERPMKRYLYMDHTWLIGQGTEREQVMKFLFEPSLPGENNVDILPIVGSKGAGKTTLALHCFYDPKVQNQFSLKIYIPWPLIGYYGYPKIFTQILKGCNSTQITNYDENTLLVMLKQNLSSERILLGMDEVWHVDSKVWSALLSCLTCGKQGSKIILISYGIRYNKFKEIVKPGNVQPIILDGFSKEEYMLFFREHAFGSADPEDFPELAKMGGEIARKMNGSVWGANIIGELLRDNLNAPFWFIFLRDGFLSSNFNSHNKYLQPVISTISQLLPKHLNIVGWGWSRGSPQDELKSTFRELMVLGSKIGKNSEVEFLVAKQFNLHECIVFTATCKPISDDG